MAARNQIRDILLSEGWKAEQVDRLLAARDAEHAHELAEKLIGDAKAGDIVYRPGIMWAAEVLDPQANEGDA